MFTTLRLKWNLRRLFKNKERIRRLYRLEIQKLRRDGGSREAIESSEAGERFEVELATEEIDSHVSDYWIRRAARSFVPIPPASDSDLWYEFSQLSGKALTPQGVNLIRQNVRGERKERMELWGMAASIVIGIVGSITGLIAVILSV